MPKLELTNLVRIPAVDLPRLTDVEVPKPVYAGAGIAGLAAAAVKEYVGAVAASAQARRAAVTAKVSGYQKQVVDFDPRTFVGAVQGRATAGVQSVTAQAKARRVRVEARVTGLQAEARALPDKVTSFYLGAAGDALGAYEELAKRGEVFVARLRGDAAATASSDGAAAPVVDAPAAKKAPAEKAPAEKAPAKKAPAKKAPARKSPARKSPATKAAAMETPAMETPAMETSAAAATEKPQAPDAAATTPIAED